MFNDFKGSPFRSFYLKMVVWIITMFILFRYNRAGGEITIEMVKDSNINSIRIRDTGIGIHEQDKLRIFDRFFRVDSSRSRHQGGSGLGLPIVKHLMELFGGAVYLLESSPQGSAFILVFPS